MLIDSNVLVYALNVDSPKHLASRLFLEKNIKEAVVAHQNILETTRIMTHPVFPKTLSVKMVTKAIEQMTRAMKVIHPNGETLATFREMVQKYGEGGNKVFDLYLASTALTNGVKEIATDNVKHFSVFEEMRVVNPF